MKGGVNFRLIKNDVPTAIIYTRVSSKEQVDNFSLDTQEEICRSYAEKNGWKVLRVFKEEGESAKTADRTQLREIIKYIAKYKGKVGKLIVYKLNRFARNTEDHFTLKVVLRRYRVELKSATEAINDDPAGELMEVVLAGISQFDNRIRAENTITGMKARLMDGFWSGIAPWGYMNTVNQIGEKIIAPHPERAPIVKMIFEMYATGKHTCLELAKVINKMDIKTRHGAKMSKQLVSKILKNHIYYGRIIVSKFEIDLMGKHESIVSRELFYKANSSRKGMSRNLPRSRDSFDYPLRGIKCDGCGKSISGGKSRSKTGKYYEYYGCVCRDCDKRIAIKKKDLEDDFTNFLLELTPNNEYLDVLKEAIKLAHKTEFNSILNEEKKYKKKIVELENNKSKLLDLRVQGDIPQKDFMDLNSKYDSDIADLKMNINSLSCPEIDIENIIDSGIKFIKEFPEKWKELHPKDLRVLRNIFFPKNLIYCYPTIKTPEVCCIYNIKPELLSDKTHWVTLPGIEPGLPA